MKRLWPLVLGLLLFGCDDNKQVPTKAVYVLLFDVSASVKPSERQAYGKQAEGIWKSLSDARVSIDRPAELVGALVSGQSLGKESKLFDVIATQHDFGGSESQDTWEAEMAKRGKEVSAATDRLIKEQRPGTEIMDSMDFVNQTFSQVPGAKKYLVIFSDMVEQSKRHNMYENQYAFSDATMKKIIDDEEHSGNLPKLNGVEVFVCGGQTVSSTAFKNFRKFWGMYFSRAGATLQPFHYSDTLTLDFKPSGS